MTFAGLWSHASGQQAFGDIELEQEFSKCFFSRGMKVFIVFHIHFNQIYDICQALGEDYYKIKEIITTPQDQPIGNSHLDPIFGLKRGFGGKCLPKDSQALAVLAESLSCKYELLDAIQTDNEQLRGILTGKPSDVITNDD